MKNYTNIIIGLLTPFCGFSATKIQSTVPPHDTAECQIAAELDAMTMQTVHCSLGARAAPHGGSGFYFTGDALYWLAEEDGLEYANRIVILENSRDSKHSLKNIDFDWHFAFRVGVGYIMDSQDQWDVLLQWTHFQCEDTGSASTSTPVTTVSLSAGDVILHPEWGGWGAASHFFGSVAGSEASVPEAKGKWKLHLDLADVELGRNYFLTRSLSWRPSIGVRTALIHQHYKADYVSLFSLSGQFGPITTQSNTGMHGKNNFNGAGLKAGTEFLWHIDKHWGIITRCGGSILYGENHIHQQFFTVNNPASVVSSFFPPETFVIKETTHPIRTNLEAALGFQWEMMFCRNKGFLSVAVLYEFSEWFAQNQFERPALMGTGSSAAPITTKVPQSVAIANRRDPGNLYLQGLNLNVKVDF